MMLGVRALLEASFGAEPPLLVLRRRELMERLFLLTLTAEMAGLITAPPRVALGILPFLVPQILTWKRPQDGIEAQVPRIC